MWALVASDNQFWGPTRGRALVLQHVCTYSWKLRSLFTERYKGTTGVNRNICIVHTSKRCIFRFVNLMDKPIDLNSEDMSLSVKITNNVEVSA